jgi:hypothetical protein
MQYPCCVAHVQHVSHKLHKQNGWLSIVSPIQPRLRPLAMVSRTLDHGRGTPFARAAEHSSRLRVPSWSRFQRLATGSSCVSENQLQMGSICSRSFCNKTDSTTAKICELETRSSGRGSGCLYTGLESTRQPVSQGLTSATPPKHRLRRDPVRVWSRDIPDFGI